MVGDEPSLRRDRYSAAVADVARWLSSVAVEQPDGLAWPARPSVSDEVVASLGWGGLGPILFFADAYRTTGDGGYLGQAEGGARWVRSLIDGDDEGAPPGLFTGLVGVAVVLDELYRASGDERLRADVARVIEMVAEQASETGRGVHWNETTEVLWGTAGIGCVLLTIGQSCLGERAVELAARAGDWLLGEAARVDAGLRWSPGEGPLRQRPFLRDAWFPNFAHGTAGIALFLARLGSVTGERRFLEAALDGARWVLSVSKTDYGTCAAQHHDPAAFSAPMQIGPLRSSDDREPLYTLGWCHGPPGLAWLFRELQVTTGDDSWSEWVSRAARTVRVSGIPERREPGFWDNVGRCCGSGGVAELFFDLHTWREDPDDLAFACLLIDDLLNRANEDDHGMRWSNIEFRHDPPELPPETTFFQGASGIGCTLLRAMRHLSGDRSTIRWPHAPSWGSESLRGR